MWRTYRTYKMAEIRGRKEHKDSKECSVITAEEYKEIKQHLNGTKQCQYLITAIESEA